MVNPKMSLDDVDQAYRDGFFTESEVAEYLRGWNGVKGRFTQAVLFDGRIRNFDPEKSGVFYRHLKDKFGLIL